MTSFQSVPGPGLLAMAALGWATQAASAFAAEPEEEPRPRLLVAPFEAIPARTATPAATLLAEGLAHRLAQEDSGVEVLTADALDAAAWTRELEACPTTQGPACARRVGRLAGMDWAITGSLQVVGDGTHAVQIQILDLRAPLQEAFPMSASLPVVGDPNTIAWKEASFVDEVAFALKRLQRREERPRRCAELEPVHYLVGPFDVRPASEPRSRGLELTDTLAAQLPAALRLGTAQGDPAALAPMGDVPSDTYLQSCPPGNAYGCTLRVAQNAGLRWAITGAVEVSPEDIGARVVEVWFVDADAPETGDALMGEDLSYPGIILVLPDDDPAAWAAFPREVAASWEAFVRARTCAPERLITAESAATPERVEVEEDELPPDVRARDLDQVDRRHGPAGGYSPAARAGDLVLEAALDVQYGSSSLVYFGDVVLDTYSDEALAIGGALEAQPRLAFAPTVGFGVGLSSRLDLVVRGSLRSGDYTERLSTREWDGWDEVYTWEHVDESEGSTFLAWGAEGALHVSLRRKPARARERERFEEEDLDDPDLGHLQSHAAGLDAARAAAAEELDELEEAEPRGLEPQAPASRVAPFVELGAGVLKLPLPPTQQEGLPSALPRFDGFTWPVARVALGVEAALSDGLDLAIAVPVELYLGPGSVAQQEGDYDLLTFAEGGSVTAFSVGFRVMARPRVGLGR
ncbi:MAG: hypothetical protein ABIO70_29535 [Pseudomonadota bacterium]